MPGRHTFLADAVIGAHGEFAEWIFALTKALAARCQRAIVTIDRLNPVEYLRNPRPIILSNYPSSQLVDSIERRDVRVLFVMEPPQLTLAFLMDGLGVSPMDGIRSQTASAVANYAIGQSPYSRIIERDTSRSVRQIVDLIVSHFELPLADAACEDVSLQAARGLPTNASVEEVLGRSTLLTSPSLGPTQIRAGRSYGQICQDIVDPLLAMARFGPTRPIVWPKEVFTFYDDPTSSPPVEAVIAGPSRNLFYGPYFYLPPMRYRVETYMVFSEEISAIPFVLEVHAGNWLARARIEERHPGHFRGAFLLNHHEATSTIEIRLRNERPVERGSLSLVEMLFFGQPQHDASFQ